MIGGEHTHGNKTRDDYYFNLNIRSFVIIKYQQTVNMSSEEESEIDISNFTSEIDPEQNNSQLDTELDIERLISLVESRPILWDKTLDKFSDRNEKRKAWREVFGLTNPGFEHLEFKDQKLIGM